MRFCPKPGNEIAKEMVLYYGEQVLESQESLK